MPIAILEHHHLLDPDLDIYDICDRLGEIWPKIQQEAQSGAFTLNADCILVLNERIARLFDTEPVIFRNNDDWLTFVNECGSIDEDPAHICSWFLSALYWNHLTRFKLATAWIYVNALRIQHGYPVYRLAIAKLGPFLESLSGSGPPIYDGQTFDPEQYS